MDSSDLTKFKRNRVASNSHNGQKATRPANKITQMSSSLIMDLVMGSRKVVNGNTTILPNCGGTNGAGCNQDLIVEDDGDVILEPPNSGPFPYWAASVFTDKFNLRPTSVTFDDVNNFVFMVDDNADGVTPPPNKFILRSTYIPSVSNQIAPVGGQTPGSFVEYYRYNTNIATGDLSVPFCSFIPGSVLYLDGRIYTYDYYTNPGPAPLPLSGLYLISMSANLPPGPPISLTPANIASGIISVFNSTQTFPLGPPGGPLPSPIPTVIRGSALALGIDFNTGLPDIYYLKNPNIVNSDIYKLINPPVGAGALSTNVTGAIPTSTEISAKSITGMRFSNNKLYFTKQDDKTIRCVETLTTVPPIVPLTPPITTYSIIAGLVNSTGTVPAYPSTAPVPADTAEFIPSDIEIVDTSPTTRVMYIADKRNNRVLQMPLVSDTLASQNKVSLFAGCEIYPYTSPIDNILFNNPAQFDNFPPPENIPALGETPPPPTNGPPYTLVPANSANLVKPLCLCKVKLPSAPLLTGIGNTQIFVGTENTYDTANPLSYGHLPLMLLKYYYT